MLQLHHLKPSPGSRRQKKIRGRGDASGHGSYSGRGIKGQRARSGVGGLAYLGMKQMVLSTPKKRGFRSLHPKPSAVNVSELNRCFADGNTVSPQTLLEKGIVGTIIHGIKILGEGELLRKLTVVECAVSESAKKKIEKAGGKVG